MGDPGMSLREEDVKRIGEYVKPWLREVVERIMPRPAVAGMDQKLLERMVRVEEELKAQRELMEVKFDAIDRRFESNDRRFESIDQRFESINKHFESVDKRFESMDQRFGDLIHHMDRRFESNDRRFESMDKRFDDVQESFKRTQWLIGLGFILLTATVTIFGVFA